MTSAERAAAEARRAAAAAEVRRLHDEEVRRAATADAMAAEEAAQRSRGDAFWGADAAAAAEAAERRRRAAAARDAAATAAETRARAMERACNAQMAAAAAAAAAAATAAEEAARASYIAAFYTAASSAEVSRYPWHAPAAAGGADDAGGGGGGGGGGGAAPGFDLRVVYNADRMIAPVSTTHRLNPLRTAGRKRQDVQRVENAFKIAGDLRPAEAGVPPVSYEGSSVFTDGHVIAPGAAGGRPLHGAPNAVVGTGPPRELWPVPVPEVRTARDVSLRGWLLRASGGGGASPTAEAEGDGPEGLSPGRSPVEGEGEGGDAPRGHDRVFAAMWRQSLLYLFPDEGACRSFLSGDDAAGGAALDGVLGYIDLEEVLCVREGAPLALSEAAAAAAAAAVVAVAPRPPPAPRDDDDDGSGGGAAAAAAAAAPGAGSGLAPPPPLRSVRTIELLTPARLWRLVPDTTGAGARKAEELREATGLEAEAVAAADRAEADAAAKEAEAAAATRSGPREGNYKLKVRSQAARASADAAHKVLAAARTAVAAARAAVAGGGDDEFLVWLRALGVAVTARNIEVGALTGDGELSKPVAAVEPHALSEGTAALVRGLATTKLGPWALAVGLMPQIQALQRNPRSAAATAAFGTGLRRGAVHTIKDRFGYIRPADRTGDQDIFFHVRDAREPVRAGDAVLFDVVPDERGSGPNDVRAVRARCCCCCCCYCCCCCCCCCCVYTFVCVCLCISVCICDIMHAYACVCARVCVCACVCFAVPAGLTLLSSSRQVRISRAPSNPYALYDELDTMPARGVNAADVFCSERPPVLHDNGYAARVRARAGWWAVRQRADITNPPPPRRARAGRSTARAAVAAISRL